LEVFGEKVLREAVLEDTRDLFMKAPFFVQFKRPGFGNAGTLS
jgi:hypothetical protein